MTGNLFRARITVQLNVGVNDPQGLTVRSSLHDLGFEQVRDVRIGKLITIDVVADEATAARNSVEAMCTELLANPVIESFEIEGLTSVSEPAEPSS